MWYLPITHTHTYDYCVVRLHYCDVKIGRDCPSNHQRHDCLLNRLFRRRSKKASKAPRHWPLCGEFTGHRWIPRTNGQLRGKYFHLMTSSWNDHLSGATTGQFRDNLVNTMAAYVSNLVLTGHQQPWHWWCKLSENLSFTTKDSNCVSLSFEWW